ncbi:MAG: glucosaminidase domain-containing protein [Deltaproteobacteria bacterium]|nr:glucosaminidase domain-containing protein [Deltaproteobacteria bacterium]
MENLDATAGCGRGVRFLPAALGAVGMLGALWGAPWNVPRPNAAARPVSQTKKADPEPIVLFRTSRAVDLARVLDEAWQEAGPAGTVPGIAPVALPSDMGLLDPETRKRTFLRAIAPHLLAVNRDIAADRRKIVAIAARLRGSSTLSENESGVLDEASGRYGVPEAGALLAAGDPAAACKLLLDHVDEVPVRLALAQAAVESGWGASRLAREDNSLFGQCAPRPSGGSAARPGPDGLWYARFQTLREGVEAYVHNLNRFWAYREFRKIRAAMRKAGAPLDSLRLAGALHPYSELGELYVTMVRALIRDSEITPFSRARLAPLPQGSGAGEATQEILALEVAEATGVPGV